jgi:hypothetical protein
VAKAHLQINLDLDCKSKKQSCLLDLDLSFGRQPATFVVTLLDLVSLHFLLWNIDSFDKSQIQQHFEIKNRNAAVINYFTACGLARGTVVYFPLPFFATEIREYGETPSSILNWKGK